MNPDTLTTTFPYHMGGAEHAETVKAACIAAAELHLDDKKGPRWDYFMECLLTSVNIDRRNKPQNLGLNLDRSDDRQGFSHASWLRDQQYTTTFSGTTYD